MEKYITKEVDYTSCHPDIADALRRNLFIECFVSDTDIFEFIDSRGFIVGFVGGLYMNQTGSKWKHARPVEKKKKYLISFFDAVAQLKLNGYEITQGKGDFIFQNTTPNGLIQFGIDFLIEMQGKEIDTDIYDLPDFLLEER